MRFFDFVSVKLSLFLILGILLGYHFKPGLPLPIIALVVCFALMAWSKKESRSFVFSGVAMTSATLLGMLVIGFSLPKNQPNHYLKTLKSTNSQHQLKVTRVLRPNTYSYRYYAEVKAMDKTSSSGEILLYQKKDSTAKPLRVDDEILTYSDIDAVSPPLNPHQFDFEDYLNKQGVHGQVRISGNQFIRLKNPSKTVVGLAANFRANLIEKLQKQKFGEEELGVIQALLLGQRNDISEATYSNYRNAGAVHILAVSGLHVGILLLLLQFILQPLERLPQGKTIKLMLIISLLWCYAFVTGLSPSIVRAVTMFSCLAYALYLNRPTNTFNILAWSLFFILLIQPLFLFQVGFQMSYAAVFAIIWVYPKLQRFWQPKTWLVKKSWQLLSVSIAAQLGVLPISLFYFHQFPALFFISNLVVVPFLGIILGMGILVLSLTYFNAVPSRMVSLYDGLIGTMNSVIAWVAQQEAFLFTDIPFDSLQLVLGYALILGLIITSSALNFKRMAFFLGTLVVFSGYLVFVSWSSQTKEGVWLLHQTRNTILLYQSGNQLNVLTPDGTAAKRPIKPFKVAQRIQSVNYDSLQNHYTFHSKKLFVIDSLGIYGGVKHPEYVLLSQSPKIHFERFLDSVQPKIVLADGSNYKSYIARWATSCRKRKLPFHYTGEKGAYTFSVKD